MTTPNRAGATPDGGAAQGPGPGPGLTTRRGVLGGGLGLGLSAVLAACGDGAVPVQQVDLEGPPQQGGTVRVGFVGGGASDTLDGAIATNLGDIARAVNMYNTLLYFDDDYVLQPLLATSVTPNDDATVWTAELREDVSFCDGRPMTAEDVIASFERIIDPEDPKSGAAALGHLEEIVKTGEHTLEFRLSTSDTALDEELGQYTSIIVPADFTVEDPVGTGPFMLESFTAAQSTVLTRNPHYWGADGPYLDEISLLNFNDTDALINALLSNQVDAVAQIPPALTEVIASDERIRILNSETGMYLPFTMRVDKAPFDDERVRQAFRLAADREGMVEQVLSGKGTIGNDMFAVFDPAYPDQLPQRAQDIAEAKRLLAEAGYPDGLEVELATAPIQAGVVEAAQVFAEHAADAGITVTINRMDLTAYWTDYLGYDFSQSFWYTRNFLAQANAAVTPGAPFNETHWDDEEFNALVEQARAEVDEAARGELVLQAQQILYDRGGYLVWGFANQVDAYQGYLGGFVENRTGIPLSGFRLDRVWIGETK
ncbi:ABC transporter substrate-binding protein [Brachybacterium sacelli]|uniref:Peptide/nickel transport system substrate-binding protein n=1 Tax=Brachybacterium sacelli TaxID=173364 RepID=A0ABS4WZ21_9MICO|nr:ABC transporter substrate-binding protein [Brachybacterium sacelli]MBP2381341.1 peptide/nickel transport system substrate-binding protein [Brachybacterium sacelli]